MTLVSYVHGLQCLHGPPDLGINHFLIKRQRSSIATTPVLLGDEEGVEGSGAGVLLSAEAQTFRVRQLKRKENSVQTIAEKNKCFYTRKLRVSEVLRLLVPNSILKLHTVLCAVVTLRYMLC